MTAEIEPKEMRGLNDEINIWSTRKWWRRRRDVGKHFKKKKIYIYFLPLGVIKHGHWTRAEREHGGSCPDESVPCSAFWWGLGNVKRKLLFSHLWILCLLQSSPFSSINCHFARSPILQETTQQHFRKAFQVSSSGILWFSPNLGMKGSTYLLKLEKLYRKPYWWCEYFNYFYCKKALWKNIFPEMRTRQGNTKDTNITTHAFICNNLITYSLNFWWNWNKVNI